MNENEWRRKISKSKRYSYVRIDILFYEQWSVLLFLLIKYYKIDINVLNWNQLSSKFKKTKTKKNKNYIMNVYPSCCIQFNGNNRSIEHLVNDPNVFMYLLVLNADH